MILPKIRFICYSVPEKFTSYVTQNEENLTVSYLWAEAMLAIFLSKNSPLAEKILFFLKNQVPYYVTPGGARPEVMCPSYCVSIFH